MRIARDLATALAPGSIVQLYGELGTGKTVFVRGLVEGVGGSPQEVTSPTFTLVQEYAGRVPVQHVDLYRIRLPEVDDLGFGRAGSGQSRCNRVGGPVARGDGRCCPRLHRRPRWGRSPDSG